MELFLLLLVVVFVFWLLDQPKPGDDEHSYDEHDHSHLSDDYIWEGVEEDWGKEDEDGDWEDWEVSLQREMKVHVSCNSCSTVLRVLKALEPGERIRCPNCDNIFKKAGAIKGSLD